MGILREGVAERVAAVPTIDSHSSTPAYTGLARTTSMVYDVAGKVSFSTDPSGQASAFAYNTLGQPTSASFLASASGPPSETIGYSYGANGRTESVTDNRGTTSMAYESGCDRVHSVTDPVTGTIAYGYSVDGRRTQTTLPSGETWTYTYADHPLNANLILPKPDPNALMLFPLKLTDGTGRSVALNCAAPGLTGGSGSGESAMDFLYDQAYDAGGTLVSYVQHRAQCDRSGESAYPTNTHNRLTDLRTMLWTKNNGGSGFTGTLLHQNDYTYDTNGQRLSNTISWQGSGTSAGTIVSREEDYGYDALSRLNAVDYGDGESQTYAFDAMGNRATKSDHLAGGSGIAASTTNESYSVDAANRLLSRTVAGTTASVSSDANGNTLSDGSRISVWDSENRLVTCTTVPDGSGHFTGSAYAYGSDGLRRASVVTTYGPSTFTPVTPVAPHAGRGGGRQPSDADDNPVDTPGGTPTGSTRTQYVYDASMLVEEIVQHFNGSGNATDTPTTITYFQGPQGPLYRKASTEDYPHWYLYDGLGSVVGEVDPTGNVTASKLFDVYGATRGYTGTPTTRQGFVGGLGHETDGK